MRCVASRLGLILLCASPALAQTGPGLPNQVFPPNDLFTIIASFGSGSYGHSFLHKGYVAALRSGNGVEFYDFSNPYSPQLVSSYSGSANGMDLSEPHTYAQTDAWGGDHVVLMRGPGGLGGTGFVISDWTEVLAPVLESSYDIPGVPGGYASGVFWIFVQAPYIYVPVGSLGLAIVDATDPQNPFLANQVSKAQLGGFNVVDAFVVGNTMILTNSDSGSGYSRVDISDPATPVLLNSIPGPIIPYGAQVNGGKLIVPAVSGCAACPTGGTVRSGSTTCSNRGSRSSESPACRRGAARGRAGPVRPHRGVHELHQARCQQHRELRHGRERRAALLRGRLGLGLAHGKLRGPG